MNTEQKEIRLSQIALCSIYRASGSSVEFHSPKEHSLYDALVKTDSFTFAVVLRSSSFLTSKAYPRFLDELQTEMVRENTLPLLLVCVNEVQESVQVACMFKRGVDTITINEKPSLQALSESNWSKIVDSLKTCIPIIMPLQKNNMKVVTNILFSKTIGNRTSKASFIYYRSLNRDNYRMKEIPATLSAEERFARNVHGTPKDEYPRDMLDKLIIGRITELFPDTKDELSLFLFNTQLRTQQTIWHNHNKNKSAFDLTFRLNTNNLTEEAIKGLADVVSLSKECQLLIYADQLHIFESFSLDINMNLKEWIDSYAILKTQLASFSTIDEILG